MRARRIGFIGLSFGGAIVLAIVCGDVALAACRFAPQGEGRVAAIIDARTFRLDDGREVRLAGIEPGTAGTRALANLIERRTVTLHGEDDRPDRYGRQSAYVFAAGANISVQTGLLSRGEAINAANVSDKDCSGEWGGRRK